MMLRLFARLTDRLAGGLRLAPILCAVTFVTMAGLCLVAGLTLRALRDDALERAEASSQNILQLIERDVARNIELLDLSLAAVVDGMRMSGIAALRPEIRHAVLFDRSASAKYLGAVLVLDRDGNVKDDSRSPHPRVANYRDRDYFQHHLAVIDPNLYVSRPYTSSTNGETVIGLSRRLEAPDGSFDGVIVGTMQLAYFGDMFAPLNVGPNGTINLHRRDGTVLMRKPLLVGAIGSSLAGSELFRGYRGDRRGTVTARALFDGVERRFSYTQIGDLPLFIDVGLSTGDMFAEWWKKAAAIGAVVLVLCVATAVLNLLLLREFRRRRHVEDSLKAANEALERLALTDPLTGLSNRRRFDTLLANSWASGHVHATPVALAMIDADHFKAYNDRYGHAGGDAVLRAIASDLADVCAGSGVEPCRIGGEEFAVLLPGGDAATVQALAERIRGRLEGRRMPHAGSPLGSVTVSIGASAVVPKFGLAKGDLLGAADSALYKAKAQGRNRTCLVATPVASPVAAGSSILADAANPAGAVRLADAVVPIGADRRKRRRAAG